MSYPNYDWLMDRAWASGQLVTWERRNGRIVCRCGGHEAEGVTVEHAAQQLTKMLFGALDKARA